MGNNYLPSKDNDFAEWAAAFSSYIDEHAAELPIQQPVVTALRSDVEDFRERIANLNTAKDAAHSACQIKDDSRATVEELIRRVARQFQASDAVTDAQREAMGLPVHGERQASAAAVIEQRPIASVDTSKRLHHTLKYWDEDSASKARPDSAKGCEIWVAVTAAGTSAPTDMDAYRNLGLNSASPFVVDYAMADGGKMAHYMLRWVGRDDEKGTWSEVVSATIVA